MSEFDNELQSDLVNMNAAVEAISRIPTPWRRQVAWNWIQSRVSSDLHALWCADHADRAARADLVGAVPDEP